MLPELNEQSESTAEMRKKLIKSVEEDCENRYKVKMDKVVKRYELQKTMCTVRGIAIGFIGGSSIATCFMLWLNN